MNMGDHMRELKAGRVEPAPVCRLLGIEILKLDPPGTAVLAMNTDSRFHNPMGTVEGGILGDLADLAMGHAFGTTLQGQESFTTLEMKINFLRPVWEGRLSATATVMHRGQTMGLVECAVVNADGKLVAKASSTVLILHGEAAAGR